jgi:hypothetical protein
MASICNEAAFERIFSTKFVIQLSKPKAQRERDKTGESFTWVVLRREDNEELILHCYSYQLSSAQRILLQFAHESFIAEDGVFPFLGSDHPQYITMQKADVRLKDLLSVVRDDIQLADTATIVHGVSDEPLDMLHCLPRKVIQALQALAEGRKLRYCSLNTSNIYVSRRGKVQLGEFFRQPTLDFI